jgi:hypothetical protein
MGLGMAAQSFPSEYDWRYMTISSLLYQDRNPHGYGWGRAGLVICGLRAVLGAEERARLSPYDCESGSRLSFHGAVRIVSVAAFRDSQVP